MNRNNYESLANNDLNRKSSESRTGNITTLNKYIDNDIDKIYINPSIYHKNSEEEKNEVLEVFKEKLEMLKMSLKVYETNEEEE